MAFVTRQRPRNPIKPGIRYYVCFASCGGNPRKNQCFSTPAPRHYHSLPFSCFAPSPSPPYPGHSLFTRPWPLLCASIYIRIIIVLRDLRANCEGKTTQSSSSLRVHQSLHGGYYIYMYRLLVRPTTVYYSGGHPIPSTQHHNVMENRLK